MATRRHGILHEARGVNATDELEAALRGEHNVEVLRECGHNDKEIEMPRKEGVLIEKEG